MQMSVSKSMKLWLLKLEIKKKKIDDVIRGDRGWSSDLTNDVRVKQYSFFQIAHDQQMKPQAGMSCCNEYIKITVIIWVFEVYSCEPNNVHISWKSPTNTFTLYEELQEFSRQLHVYFSLSAVKL